MDKLVDKEQRDIAWWVWILLAVCCYVGMRYLLPVFILPEGGGPGAALKALSPLVTMLFLLMGAFALYKDEPVEKSEESEIQD